MKRYLLDTCTAIWSFDNVSALSQIVKDIIRDISNPIYISIASAWELAIKIGIDKMNFPDDTAGFLRAAQANQISILPIKGEHLSVLETMPMHHRDPFDRLLVASAISENMTLVTADKNIALYNVDHIW